MQTRKTQQSLSRTFNWRSPLQRASKMFERIPRLSARQSVIWYDMKAHAFTLLLCFAR